MENLTRLIALIEAKIAAAGDTMVMTNAQRRVAGETILRDLSSSEGASFAERGHDYSLRLAGVRSTCTSGHFGLLRNWMSSARRRIAEEQAKAGAA